MENAVDALKIAFAMIVFVIAITITFLLISQAKSTADVVLYHTDKTNFYEHVSSATDNRTVSVSDVISTLYRYYKESISVTVKLGPTNIKTFDLANSSISLKKVEEDLGEYVKDNLLRLNEDSKFTEEFVEAPIGGEYKSGEDGTEITLASGTKKIYITYTLQN